MRLAYNITPLTTSHKYRGIGYYTDNLLRELKKDNSIEIVEFTKLSDLNKHVDIIHYPWFDLFFHSLPLRLPAPLVVTIHDVMPLVFSKHYPPGIKGRINLWLQVQALKKSRFIITDSQTSKIDIIKNLKIAESKVFPISLAASSNFRILRDTELIRTKIKYNLPEKFLLYVGDANWVKNLPVLIESFKRLLDNPQFSEFKLILVGNVFLKNVESIDHPELSSLKKVNRLIKEHHLETRIIRPGTIEENELVAFFNLASVYVQPSLYEGFGLPVLEAMACGTPVISSNTGSLREVASDAAIYFDPSNIDQLIKIMIEVLTNKSLQTKLTRLGLEQAKKFSWSKTAEETKKVYKKALNLYA